MEEARQLFRNRDTTEFVIVTIPTVMAVAESGRLAKVGGCRCRVMVRNLVFMQA
jgi:hypothetical protein